MSKIKSTITLIFVLCFSFSFSNLEHKAQSLEDRLLDFSLPEFPSMPLFIPEGESLTVYEHSGDWSPHRELSGANHQLIGRRCISSTRFSNYREECNIDNEWYQVLDSDGQTAWFHYIYHILPDEWNSDRYNYRFAPYIQPLRTNTIVTLYAQPNHDSDTSVLEDIMVEGYALIYGFNYDATGVWYLVRYNVVEYEESIMAWVHKPFPERLHWNYPMPDLPHVFIAENPLEAENFRDNAAPLEMTIEAREIVLMYYQASLSGYYDVAILDDGDWQQLGVPLEAIDFSSAVRSRVPGQRGE